jgi:hypothetical protein
MDQGWTSQPTSPPPEQRGSGARAGFSDFLNFRYMIAPRLITILWMALVIVITIGALVALNTSPLAAVVGWALVMLWVRVVFEVMIVLFRINDGIQTMARRR